MEDPLKNSIVVVAHPDDEALWFGSLLRRVDALVICYLEIPSKPQINEGRRRFLAEYPLENMDCIGLSESGASRTVNWKKAKMAEYGLLMTKNNSESKKYIKNYSYLREMLRRKLWSHKNVFTHNPWGEYGHAEHVQVYSAVKSLQTELGFRIWCSNYCSNTTFDLMSRHISSCVTDYFTLEVDEELVKSIRDLYMKNGIWTWYKDWDWFRDESFIQDSLLVPGISEVEAGHLFPVNIIKMPEIKDGNVIRKMARRIISG